MDVFLLHAVREELARRLIDARLTGVHQIDARRFVLTFRCSNQSCYLLLCPDPSRPRLHLASDKGNARAPEHFCTLLKNRLTGALLDDVEQEGMERVLLMRFKRRDELGRIHRFMLAAEMIPRVPNLILVDGEGVVIDALRRTEHIIDGRRNLNPGIGYSYPPPQTKADPLAAERESVEKLFSDRVSTNEIAKKLLDSFAGLSPLMARELGVRVNIGAGQAQPDPAAVWEEFRQVMDCYREDGFHPTVYFDKDGLIPLAATPFPFVLYREHRAEHFESPSQTLEYYHSRRGKSLEEENRRRELSALCSSLLKKLSSRRRALQTDLEEAQRAEEFKRKGALILTNMRSIRKGAESETLTDPYEEVQEKVMVELDPSLDASANAQRYFKRYTKLKKKGQIAGKRLKDTDELISRLTRLNADMRKGGDARKTKDCLIEMGLLWPEAESAPEEVKSKAVPGGIVRHVTPDGWEILVGKNSRANDYLTTRVAGRNDLWLHVRGQPGAHVVIRKTSAKAEIPAHIIEKAALLAALNSKARNASKATVDYVLRKHVSKPKGAPPGTVTIKRSRSITVSLRDANGSG